MSRGPDLEQRYRRVLRLLPGYYRDTWEEDMVAAFLDTWMTGDPDEDSVTMEVDRPSRAEVASVIGLAARLYLGGAGAPRRYFAWGQAVRGAVLAVPGPGALPRGPGGRGAGRRPGPGLAAAGAAHREPAVALRVVGVLVPDRPGPGPGHGRVPPGCPADRAPALAAGTGCDSNAGTGRAPARSSRGTFSPAGHRGFIPAAVAAAARAGPSGPGRRPGRPARPRRPG